MTSIPGFTNITLEKHDNIFIITLQNPPENKLGVAFCQEIIRALRTVEQILGPDAEGAVVMRGDGEKFFCTGVDMDEARVNPFIQNDGFHPLISTILDFPYPTIALLNGHTFGAGSLLALAHDYRVMNSARGYISCPPMQMGLHSDAVGILPKVKLSPVIARKMLLEVHRWKAEEALKDGVVDAIAEPERMFDVAVEIGRKWAGKAKMGMYGLYRGELYPEAIEAYQKISHVHRMDTSRRTRMELKL